MNFKRKIIIFFLLTSIFVLGQPVFVSGTDLVDTLKNDLKITAEKSALNKTASDSLPDVIGNLIGAVLSLTGLLFFGLMVYGGIIWMTSHGNEQDTKKAFDIIIGAIIGILIIVSAYAITTFMFESLKKGETVEVVSYMGACDKISTKLVCEAVNGCDSEQGQKPDQNKCVNESGYCDKYTDA